VRTAAAVTADGDRGDCSVVQKAAEVSAGTYDGVVETVPVSIMETNGSSVGIQIFTLFLRKQHQMNPLDSAQTNPA
jgi:hypothetical protein